MVEGTGLENRRASNGTEGSNPSLSARREVVRHSPGHFSSIDEKDSNNTVRSQASLAEACFEKESIGVAKRHPSLSAILLRVKLRRI